MSFVDEKLKEIEEGTVEVRRKSSLLRGAGASSSDLAGAEAPITIEIPTSPDKCDKTESAPPSVIRTYDSRGDVAHMLEMRDRHLDEDGYSFNWIHSYSSFQMLVDSCQRAIDEGTLPERILQGSSGSYFIKSPDGRIAGVFKPKDEEPYGNLNPKWIKWLHRTCCPCLFGRSFLMPNTGYISEAAASLVDSFLDLNVVPRTLVAHLTSSQFVYPWWDRYAAWKAGPEAKYPLKSGSFQLFVQNFEPSMAVLERLALMQPWDAQLREAFQEEFEKMTILDYVIRNTDRSMDNWLIHLSWHPQSSRRDSKAIEESEEFHTPLTTSLSDSSLPNLQGTPRPDWTMGSTSPSQQQPATRPVIKIACIDNGLAFPMFHPTEVRSYPYSWAFLPQAAMPYSDKLRERLLPLLTEVDNWEALIGRLKQIFQIDSDFNEEIFSRQMAVMRGQLYNLVQVLQKGQSPLDLVSRPLVMIDRQEDEGLVGVEQSRQHRITSIHDRALCSWC